MITDHIENSGSYPFGPLWDQAFEFLKTVTPETASGKYPIRGEDLFVIVDRYETRPRTKARLETHRRYIDIQIIFCGEEIHEVFDAGDLETETAYNPEKDVKFYHVPDRAPVFATLTPGRFAVYFPQDAHMPCLMTGGRPQPVLKAVVKLAADQIADPEPV